MLISIDFLFRIRIILIILKVTCCEVLEISFIELLVIHVTIVLSLFVNIGYFL